MTLLKRIIGIPLAIIMAYSMWNKLQNGLYGLENQAALTAIILIVIVMILLVVRRVLTY